MAENAELSTAAGDRSLTASQVAGVTRNLLRGEKCREGSRVYRVYRV